MSYGVQGGIVFLGWHRLAGRAASGLLVVLLGAGLFGSSSAQARAPGGRGPVARENPSLPVQPRAASIPKYAPNELLVRFRRGTPKFRSESIHTRVRAQVVKQFTLVPDLELVRLPEGMAVEQAAGLYRRNPEVLYAEPNYVYQALQGVTPNDPRFADLWGLNNTGQSGGTLDADIDAPEAWSLGVTGSPDVVVGVIDSGIDYTHEDLAANMFRNELDCNSNGLDDDGNGFIDDCHGIDTFNFDSDPIDDLGHGTHVAGTIGAVGNNGIGVVGVNWQVKLIACKFLGGQGFGFTSGAIACLEYLSLIKDAGVNLVATNNSWGGGGFSQALLDAIDAHRQRGILFIAAAGNSAADNDVFTDIPSGYYLPNIIAVAATTRTDARASFSNFGRRSVHLGAPGLDILSTFPGNTYGSISGTSMATPHVAGAAALLAAQDPLRDWKAIKNLLLAGGDAISSMTGLTISQKRLNVNGAMTCASSTVLSRLQPRTSVTSSSPGLPLDLAVLHINCALPNGSVTVSVDGGVEIITLLDDGQGADQEADDGIYSAQWVPSTTGRFTLAFPNETLTVDVLTPYRFSSTTFAPETITGQNLNMGDDTTRVITSPFPIPFGGASFTQLFVTANGAVSFHQSFGLFHFESSIPGVVLPTVVAAFWDDLFPVGSSRNVFWGTTGIAPNRKLVIEWRDVSHFACFEVGDTAPSVKFQMVFFEGSPNILFNYIDTVFGGNCAFADNGGAATVGVQVATRVGAQFSFLSPTLADNSSILWELGHPAPAVTRLSPFTALVGDPDFTLKVIGTNFVPGAVVRWGGVERSTSFVSSTQLTAAISAADVVNPATVQVSVFNPPVGGVGGGPSNDFPFTVYSSHPVPLLTSVVPNLVLAGRPGFTLTLTGSDFVSPSIVRWNGADRPTTAISSTQLTATISSSDIATAGTAEVTIFNPLPGGGTSNALTVQIDNFRPQALFLTSDLGAGGAAVAPGGPDFTLSVFGDFFVPDSVVRWNGADRPTTFAGEFRFLDLSELRAQIPAGDIVNEGTAQVTVFNPPPGGGVSNPLTFTIVAPPPNDNFASAVVAATAPFTHTTVTATASAEPGDPTPTCVSGLGARSVWYQFTPTTNAPITADTFGSNYHTVLSVWTGSPGSFTQVACNPGSTTACFLIPRESRVSFTPTPGTTYSFMITQHCFVIIPPQPPESLVFNLNQPDFTVGAAPASATVTRGQAATYTITLTPMGGFSGTTSLSCSGLPAQTTCSFSPPSVTVSGSTATSTLTISTTAPSAWLMPPFGPDSNRPLYAFWLALPGLALLGLAFGRGESKEKKLLRLCLSTALLLGFLLFQVACGGGGSKPPPNPGTPLGTHNITVNGASGALQRSTTVTLVVQ